MMRVLLRAGRVIGTAAGVMATLLFLFAFTISGLLMENPPLGLTMTALVVIPLVGIVLAWWDGKEVWGAALVMAAALALGLLVYATAGSHNLTAALVYSLPFLAAGLLLLICRLVRRGGL